MLSCSSATTRTSSALLIFLSLLFTTALAQNPPEPDPAFPGQTEAPRVSTSMAYRVEKVAGPFTGPWSIAFLPDGEILVTENYGGMRIVSAEGVLSDPIAGVPGAKQVAAEGMHDVMIDPDFANNRTLYFTWFAPPAGEEPGQWPLEHFYDEIWNRSLAERRSLNIGTETISVARLSEDLSRLEAVRTLYEGGTERRLVAAPDGTLFGIGADMFRFYDSDLDGTEKVFTDNPDIRRNFTGRVIRINYDGTVPADNPWMSRATVARETYAHGLKDPEGAAIHPQTGELWVIDHGPQGGDEINIIRPGRDYGWPNVSYGVQYDDRQSDGRINVPVGNGQRSMEGVEEPIYFWVPSIAPSGMAFYTADLLPEWQGNLFIGAMAGRALVRIVLDGERVIGEERLLEDLDQRIREVRQGPDGAIYFLAGSDLMRILPE